jgi:hypothetical protein
VLKNVALLLVGGLLTLGGFMAGRSSAVPNSGFSSQPTSNFIHVQNTQTPVEPVRPNNDARELIPLNPGQQPGGQGNQPPPGQKPQDCPVQIYQDGKLYTFPQPGTQNGQQSGQPQEIIPLQPNVAPSTPNSAPSTPAQPRNVPITPSQPSTPSTPNTADPENPLNPFAPTLPNTRS